MQLLSSKRLGTTDLAERSGRSEFEADIDRITFSNSFRRLSRKTQVHPLAVNDHIHSRLTHSLEVSRVGYTLGSALYQRLNARTSSASKYPFPDGVTRHDLGSIVQAACLAHDIGNPPFGHAGEDASIAWFNDNVQKITGYLKDKYHQNDLCSVEGNAQGFRILTQLENHLFDGGLRLTYATLGTFQKYPRSSRCYEKKFGSYITEESILNEVMGELGVPKVDMHSWARHPLAYLVEAADDICYSTIDTEDAVELGILNFSEVADVLLSAFDDEEKRRIESSLVGEGSHRVNFARLRGPVFQCAIDATLDIFSANYEDIMEGNLEYKNLLEVGQKDKRCFAILGAKDLGRKKIYNDTKKVELEIGCYNTLGQILENICRASVEQSNILSSRGHNSGEVKLGGKYSRILKLMGDHAPNENNMPPGCSWDQYQCLRRAIDYVNGMTDNYATYIAKQMRGDGFAG